MNHPDDAAPWNLRTTANPLIRRAGRRLAQINARHPWDHNAAAHPWILRSLPRGARSVLDVGCGRGDLALALSGRAARVEGIDPDPVMAASATERLRPLRSVRIRQASLADLDPADEQHDAVTMVASLHHMPLEEALAQARELLRPGGRLLISTLVRPEGPVDQLWDLGNALSNPVIGMIRHPRVAAVGAGDAQMPVRDAPWGTAELARRAEAVLPGIRVRRSIGFRVRMAWQRGA